MTLLKCVEPAEQKGEDKYLVVAGSGDELVFPHVDVCIAVACVLPNGNIVGGHIPFAWGDEKTLAPNQQLLSARRMLKEMQTAVGTSKVDILITLCDDDYTLRNITDEIVDECKPAKRVHILKWVEGGANLHLFNQLVVVRPFKHDTEVIYQCTFDNLPGGRKGVKVTRDPPKVVQADQPARKWRCYLTTATCLSLGLPDDCDELTTLRWFRDEVLLATDAGRREVAEYYEVAPAIVAALDRTADAARVYRAIYREGIAPAVAAVKRRDFPQAHALLSELIADLRRRYEAE